jgi:hypothetical protein
MRERRPVLEAEQERRVSVLNSRTECGVSRGSSRTWDWRSCHHHELCNAPELGLTKELQIHLLFLVPITLFSSKKNVKLVNK